MGIRLWKHKNGVYYVLWEEDGRTRSKSLKTTDKARAMRNLRSFQRDILQGKVKMLDADYQVHLKEFREEYLKYCESKEQGTYNIYKTSLEKAEKTLGNILIGRISTRLIDVFIADMIKEGLAVPTINKHIRSLKTALSKAYEWEYIKKPVVFPKKIKEYEVIRYLPIEDFRRLFSYIDDPEFFDFCLLSAYSGMRSGEILRLRRSDIDNPKGFIRISAKQKNKRDERIPITKAVREILNRSLARKNKKVFKYNCLTHISQRFKMYARIAGLENARFHDLRHSYASHLAMAGEDIYTIQKLMRHSSPVMTAHYAKLSPSHLRGAGEKLNYGALEIPIKKKG